MRTLIDLLGRNVPLGRPLGVAVVVAGLFLLAWIVSRVAARLAVLVVDRNDRRRGAGASFDTDRIAGLRQRETAVSLIQTTVRYLAVTVAIVLSLVALSGAQHLQTIVGASFLAIVVAFAAQRFLTDVIAGLLMFFEG